MSIITLLSDFGTSDYYVAAIKGQLLSLDRNAKIVDISHHIAPFDVMHAAFVMNNAFHSFPKGTVHIIFMKNGIKYERCLAAVVEGHTFLCYDNGILGLISQYNPQEVFLLNREKDQTTKQALINNAIKLSKGEKITKLGHIIFDFQLLFSRNVRRTGNNQLIGNVLRVDNYGNLITNISKEHIEKFNPENKPIEIHFGKEVLYQIETSIKNISECDCFCLFNSNNFLKIGMKDANASQLLGLHVDSNIIIHFTYT